MDQSAHSSYPVRLTMYYVLLAASAACLGWFYFRNRPGRGMGWAIAAGLVFPVWVLRQVGGIELNLRTSVALLAVAALLTHPGTRLRTRLVLADLAALAIAASAVIAVALGPDGFRISQMVFYGLIWLLPYVLGRLAYQSREDTGWLTRCMTVGVLIVSLWAVSESVARVNVVGRLAGRPSSMQGEDEYRFGFKRAEGPVEHPIFLGMLIVLAFPWTLDASQQAAWRVMPRFFRCAPLAVAAGVAASLSRGPQLALLAGIYLAAVVRFRRWRPWLLSAAVAGAVGLFSAQALVVEWLHLWSDPSGATREIVVVGGRRFVYTGTNHRTLLFLVYEKAASRAGWFGYGHLGPNEFPHVEEHLRFRFLSIDNHYLYTVLTTGYVGLASFLTLQSLVLAYLIGEVRRARDRHNWLWPALLGMYAAVSLILLTVWFPPDFGYVWLVQAGIVASRHAESCRQRRRCGPHRVGSIRPARHLTPGHPPSTPAAVS